MPAAPTKEGLTFALRRELDRCGSGTSACRWSLAQPASARPAIRLSMKRLAAVPNSACHRVNATRQAYFRRTEHVRPGEQRGAATEGDKAYRVSIADLPSTEQVTEGQGPFMKMPMGDSAKVVRRTYLKARNSGMRNLQCISHATPRSGDPFHAI
jgi:hypothetical protein